MNESAQDGHASEGMESTGERGNLFNRMLPEGDSSRSPLTIAAKTGIAARFPIAADSHFRMDREIPNTAAIPSDTSCKASQSAVRALGGDSLTELGSDLMKDFGGMAYRTAPG